MMKKWLLLFFASITLAACGTTATDDVDTNSVSESAVVQEDPEASTVTISIAVDGEEIEDGSKTIEIESGAILLDVLKENYEIVEENGFITSINGHQQDEDAGKYWLFDVNGEMGLVGAQEQELDAGDLVEFNLSGI